MAFSTHPFVVVPPVLGRSFFSCLLLLFFGALPAWSQPSQEELLQALKSQLVCYPIDLVRVSEPKVSVNSEEMCLSLIYQGLGSTPLWVTPEGPTANAELILGFLSSADQHGLDPRDYKVDILLQLWSSRIAADLARLETSLSYGLVKYIYDISHGQLKPHETGPDLFAEAGNQDFDPLLTIKQALQADDLQRFLSNLPPNHHHYRALQTALGKYRKLASTTSSWPQIGDGESIRPGQRDPRIPAVRERLAITGELGQGPSPADELFYDDNLVEAVKVFQKYHGLTRDGVIGKKTRVSLNISASQKVDMIRINMARWRWHAHELGDKYILVNIASFNLRAYSGNSTVPALDFAVIVGQDQHQTPVFSDTIAYLDFNPFWNVTPSIAANEELPALRQDSSHLAKRRIRLFSSWQPDAVELDSTSIDWYSVTPGQMRGYKLRQDPGPWNALGKVKFVFPNRYSVYMHDTATPNLFQRTQRDFSHGCIRVSDPFELAVFVLENQEGGWTREKIEEVYKNNSRKVIQLSAPIPVHITYQTTWVDKDGAIHFNNDIYARDERLLSVLIK